MSTIKVTYGMDEKIASTIDTLARQKGVLPSSLINRFCELGLKNEYDLTPVQRYHALRLVHENRLDDVLKVAGIMDMKGSMSDKFRTLIYACPQNHGHKNAEHRNGLMELSVFELLNVFQEYDPDLFLKCKGFLPKRMKERYNKLYPEKK